MGSVKFWLK